MKCKHKWEATGRQTRVGVDVYMELLIEYVCTKCGDKRWF